MSGLVGDLSFATVPALLTKAAALAAGGALDLREVTRIDTAGAAFLLELSRRAQGASSTLTIRNAAPQVAGLIRFLELDEVLKLEA